MKFTTAIALAAITGANAFTTNPGAFTVAPSTSNTNNVFTPETHRTRRSTIVMDGKANAIRDRISTVNNTKKITSAMKLVAAAKVRRAQDSVMATRPFSDTLQSVFGGLINRLGGEAADLPLLTQREVNKVTLTVITGDRGLCGGYNSFMIKKAEARFNELKAQGIDCDMILIGKKGASYFQRREYPIRKIYDTGQNPDSKQALAISEEIINTFLSGETGKFIYVFIWLGHEKEVELKTTSYSCILCAHRLQLEVHCGNSKYLCTSYVHSQTFFFFSPTTTQIYRCR